MRDDKACGMADALGDGSWRSWSQDQAHEVEREIDRLRAEVERLRRERDDAVEKWDRAIAEEEEIHNIAPGGSVIPRERRTLVSIGLSSNAIYSKRAFVKFVYSCHS